MELHRVCAAVYVCCAVLCCAVCVCGWSHLHLHAPVLYVCVEEEGGKGGGVSRVCVRVQASQPTQVQVQVQKAYSWREKKAKRIIQPCDGTTARGTPGWQKNKD